MALLYMDGFDARDFTLRWTTAPDGYTTGRLGGGSAYMNTGGASGRWIPASATVVVGLAYQGVTFGASGFREFLRLYSDTGTTWHLGLQVTSNNNVVLTRAGTVLATATGVLTATSWNYLELRATIADAGGRATVRVNGNTVIDFTGDTRNGGTSASMDFVQLLSQATGGSNQYYVDDLYVLDATGPAPNNDFLGDVRVVTLTPTGAGNTTGLTPSTGANWSCVDELPYSASDFVSASAAGAKDTYACADLPAGTAAVYGVQLGAIAKKTDAGTRSLKTVVRRAGTDYSDAGTALATSDSALLRLLSTDPSTGAAWTPANVNAMEIGVAVA
jgi:hypothetical protein